MTELTRLLCLSNGHGEDEIAVRILQALQQQCPGIEVAALPIVGMGRAYRQQQIAVIGPVQAMPSGGFIYMDGRQLARDVQKGLLQLTAQQLQAVRVWAKQGGLVLAVGDIVPLLFAWLSGAPYAFVGTAKSEYYLRDESGPLPRRGCQRWEGWSGSDYLPWERWLMGHRRCQAVFPRDRLTTEILKQWSLPAFDMGNPMMDDLEPQAANLFQGIPATLTILLLPGSRPPEAYANWQQITQALTRLVQTFESILFLGAIAPGLDLESLTQTLLAGGWQRKASAPVVDAHDPTALTFTQQQATLILIQQAFRECLHQADLAIAMAGTATEQFVGLGKPAILIPGKGPQFTARFAEAQTRLLGPSVTLVEQPQQVADVVKTILSDCHGSQSIENHPLNLFAENGQQRMGKPGAAHRIAKYLLEASR